MRMYLRRGGEVLRPNINMSRRISPGSKIISAFFISFIITVICTIFIFSSLSFSRFSTKASESSAESDLILGTQELSSFQPTPIPSPTPSPTPVPTPTPIPTPSFIPTPSPIATPLVSQSSSSEDDSILSQGGNYSGPALEPASEKKDLLIISDSFPEDWPIEKNEGANFVQGKVGKALFLNPGELVFSSSEAFANAGTLSFWFKLESETKNGESPLIDWNFEGGDYRPSLFEISVVENRLLFSIYDETGNQDDINGQLENPFEWHYVVVTWDLTKEPYERVLYFDGKKVASGGFPFAVATSEPSLFQIGGTLGSRNPISFKIDELVLINWVKSESEIVQ